MRYIKIRKISFDSKTAFLMHMLSAIGDSIDAMSAKAMLVSLYDNNLINQRELSLMLSSTSDRALIRIMQGQSRDMVRADIMKALVLSLK
jgi:transcriptional regulator CtsR